MDGADSVNKDVQPVQVTAASALENNYFYPEANGYQAMTVRASTREDAQAIYLAKRQLKVADSETNNE